MSIDAYITKVGAVAVQPKHIKKSNPFTCLGWVRDPFFNISDSLILLAVADEDGNVDTSDSAIKIEIIRDDRDYRLRFSNSISKKIELTLGISINDTSWHFLAYVCTGEGVMHYYVDGLSLGAEGGVGDEGVLNATAWSRNVRLGGGNVWVPYLYESGQSITLYNWRFSSDLILHQDWINELMEVDRSVLYTDQQ